MTLSDLDHYTTLIQLITAVNFAYIFTKFHDKVFTIFFNVEDIIKKHCTSFINEITIDKASLASMEPIVSKAKSNATSLSNLKARFEELYNKWEEKKKKLGDEIKHVREIKGIKSLFLFVSLFCLVDLFNIATCAIGQKTGFEQFSVAFCVITVLVSLFLTVEILKLKFDKMSEVCCYKRTAWFFVITCVASLAFLMIDGTILVRFNKVLSNDILIKIACYSAIFLPFYPCFISIVYILFQEMRFKVLSKRDTGDLKKLKDELHAAKTIVDASYELFSDITPPRFG